MNRVNLCYNETEKPKLVIVAVLQNGVLFVNVGQNFFKYYSEGELA